MRESGQHCDKHRFPGFGSPGYYGLVSTDGQEYDCDSYPWRAPIFPEPCSVNTHFDQLSKLVSIHLSAALDADLRGRKKRGGRPKKTSRAFHELLATYGMTAKPLFADNPDPGAESIWHAAIPDEEAAEIVEKLVATPGVTAAYVKSAEEPPGPP